MATKNQVRAGCYLRISSDPKDKRAGIDRQREDTVALCEVEGWKPVEFYPDNDRSASNGKQRPEWDRLLADIKAGKLDAIAAWDQDRGWRLMSELEELRRFFTGLGRKVQLATTGQGDIDLYSPTGVLAAQIKTAVSEHEIAMMKVRMRRAARQKAERGEPQWRRAFGFLDDTRQPDPETAPLVKAAYAAVLAGSSISDIAREWNRAGALTLRGKPWNAALVSQFLRKARNAGLRTHNAPRNRTERCHVVGPGNWPPLVDQETFWAVQAKLNEPGRAPGRKSVRRHLLTGVLTCGKCGGPMNGMWVMQAHRGGPRAHAITYACRSVECRGVSVRAEHVEPLVYGLVSDRLAQPDAVDLLRAEQDDAQAEALRTERATLLARLDEIADERADGLLTGAQAKRATERINVRLADLERRQQDAERLRVFADLPLGTPEVAEAVEGLSADRFRAVLGVMATVTVQGVGKGSHVFTPERVVVDWRR